MTMGDKKSLCTAQLMVEVKVGMWRVESQEGKRKPFLFDEVSPSDLAEQIEISL
jgi:hypothetical protein